MLIWAFLGNKLLINFQVTRVVLLWVNNHFNDFEGDPAMTRFLEEFEKNLENTVGAKKNDCHTFCIMHFHFPVCYQGLTRCSL